MAGVAQGYEDDDCEVGDFGQQHDDLPLTKYEYLDHTADVQIHSWGDNLSESFEQCAMAMFGYMTTNYNSVEMTDEQEIEAKVLVDQFRPYNMFRVCSFIVISFPGDDMLGLLFHFLDEWLFVFSAEPFFIARKVVITEFDRENLKIKAKGYGEEFDITKHPQKHGVESSLTPSIASSPYVNQQGKHACINHVHVWPVSDTH